MSSELIPVTEICRLAENVLHAAGTSRQVAAIVAAALVRADLDGIASHGVLRLPYYAEHVARGRVDGTAAPTTRRLAAGTAQVDARHGFAFPAIKAARQVAAELASATGIACVGITRSHHAGALGHAVEDLAENGLIALMTANSGPVLPGPGGKRPLLGTNPIAFGFPRREAPPLVIDMSVSIVARGSLAAAAARGERIPEGWALGPDGDPTTDPAVAMNGTLLAIGGAKGSALALALELLASAASGAAFSHQNTSYFQLDGPRFSGGQFILAIDPRRIGDDDFASRAEALCGAVLAEEGVRLPGDRRLANRARLTLTGIPVPSDLLRDLRRRAASAASLPAADNRLPAALV
ncbi:MAG TPA: Ldh family oxidoreductase [Stellaceae bacterium]|nr:Ldh family oxidoreductase [Stellaceae bacterium]